MPDVTAPHDTAPPPPVAGAQQPKGKPQGVKGQSKEKKDKKAGAGASSGPLEVTPPPQFFEDRIKIWDEYMAKYKQHVAGEFGRPQTKALNS